MCGVNTPGRATSCIAGDDRGDEPVIDSVSVDIAMPIPSENNIKSDSIVNYKAFVS